MKHIQIRVVEPTVADLVAFNRGYCPTAKVWTPETKCMCNEFAQQPYPGLCRCGRYEKVFYE